MTRNAAAVDSVAKASTGRPWQRVFVALGGNLPHPSDENGEEAPPRETLAAAVKALECADIRVKAVSRWYESAPVPRSDQPWYVNAVAALETTLDPAALLTRLHEIEVDFGRERSTVNAPRTLDLDLIDYEGRVASGDKDWPRLPHPRARQRAFVLLPLADLAPDWRDPVSGKGIAALIAGLPQGQICRPMPG